MVLQRYAGDTRLLWMPLSRVKGHVAVRHTLTDALGGITVNSFHNRANVNDLLEVLAEEEETDSGGTVQRYADQKRYRRHPLRRGKTCPLCGTVMVPISTAPIILFNSPTRTGENAKQFLEGSELGFYLMADGD